MQSIPFSSAQEVTFSNKRSSINKKSTSKDIFMPAAELKQKNSSSNVFVSPPIGKQSFSRGSAGLEQVVLRRNNTISTRYSSNIDRNTSFTNSNGGKDTSSIIKQIEQQASPSRRLTQNKKPIRSKNADAMNIRDFDVTGTGLSLQKSKTMHAQIRTGNEDFFEAPIDKQNDCEQLLKLKNEAMNPFRQASKKESTPWYLFNVSLQENLKKIQELDEAVGVESQSMPVIDVFGNAPPQMAPPSIAPPSMAPSSMMAPSGFGNVMEDVPEEPEIDVELAVPGRGAPVMSMEADLNPFESHTDTKASLGLQNNTFVNPMQAKTFTVNLQEKPQAQTQHHWYEQVELKIFDPKNTFNTTSTLKEKEVLANDVKGRTILVEADGKKAILKQINVPTGFTQKRNMEQKRAALTRLNHCGLVKVYSAEWASQNTQLHVMSEFINGKQLDQLDTPLDQATVINYFEQMIYPLKYLSSVGIQHRDLKAKNVFVNNDGRIKIADYANILLAESLNQQSSFFAGNCQTNSIQSPELIQNMEQIDSQVDVFALGAIVYQLATGNTPFPSKDNVKRSRQILNGEVEPFPVGLNLNSQFKQLIVSMLHPEASARPNLDQIMHNLDQFKSKLGLQLVNETSDVSLQLFSTKSTHLMACDRVKDDLLDTEDNDEPQLERHWYSFHAKPQKKSIQLSIAPKTDFPQANRTSEVNELTLVRKQTSEVKQNNLQTSIENGNVSVFDPSNSLSQKNQKYPAYTEKKVIQVTNEKRTVLLENLVTGKNILLKKFSNAKPLDEAKLEAIKRLDHPGLVKVFSAEVQADSQFFLIDYVEGKNLSQVIDENPFSFSESQVLLWLEQMTYPLKYLHDNKISHGELNEKNIFVDSKNRVTLGDLCKSTLLNTQVPTSQDIYALGVIALQLCNLTDAKQLAQQISIGNTHGLSSVSISDQLKQLIIKMLAKEKEQYDCDQILNQIDLIKSKNANISKLEEVESETTLRLFSTKKVHLLPTNKVIKDDLLGSDSEDDDIADEKQQVFGDSASKSAPFNYTCRTYHQPKQLSFSLKL